MASDNEKIIFYSWQSDHSKTRSFVEGALKIIIDEMNSDSANLTFTSRLDSDTQGTTGAVEIANTILSKIDACDIFVADVSLVDKSYGGRSLSNQNVLFELGYAVGRKTYAFVILVANQDLGSADDLPFDIRGRRVILFSPEKDKKGSAFRKSLKYAIVAELGALPNEQVASELDTKSAPGAEELKAAIKERRPTRSLSERYFQNLYEQYVAEAPPRLKRDDNLEAYRASIYNKYQDTRKLTDQYHEVVELAAEYGDENTIAAAYKQLEILTKFYDIVDEDNGQMFEASKEYYGLVVYELLCILVGCLIKDDRWDAIANLKAIKLNRPKGYGDPRNLDRLYVFPQQVTEYYKMLKDRNYAVPLSPMLEERFADRQDILKTYSDGAITLYFLIDHFYPWTVGFLLGSDWQRFVPDYIEKLSSAKFAQRLMLIADIGQIDQFREMIKAKASRSLSSLLAYHYDDLTHVFAYGGIDDWSKIGSKA